MSTLGNILWFIFGGFITSLLYFVMGILLCITIIGIPFGVQLFKFGVQHFKIAGFSLLPFGRTIN